MISGTIIGGDKAIARFSAMPGRLRDELRAGIGRAVLKLQAYVKTDKLSGQVLQVRTGRLRRSITERLTEESARVVGIVGTNVAYARVHEYGFSGSVNVREHLRQSKTGAMALVRGHSRNMHLPERSFLRSALADMTPEIRNEVQAALNRAIAP